MNINSNWKNVTRTQLNLVAPPNPGTASRLAETTGDTAGDTFTLASQRRHSAEQRSWACSGLGLGAVAVGGGAAALLAGRSLPWVAGAAGTLGGALALTAGYFAVTASAEATAWQRFGTEVEAWAGQAQAHLVRPGSLPGTEENHNFLEAGSFKSLCDVRRNNVVVAREAELAGGLKLHEDVATQTVTAQSVAGPQTFSRATLELPTSEGDRTLRLKTWSADGTPVVQQFSAHGTSKVTFGDSDTDVQVYPHTRMDHVEGCELPDRTVRFEFGRNSGNYGEPAFSVFYARPPLAGCDFSADFPVFSAPTTRPRGHGQETSRVRPETPLESLKTRTENLEDALQTRQLSLAGGVEVVEDAGTGQVRVARGGQTLRTHPGQLNLTRGTLTEKQGQVDVCQDLTAWPRVAIKTGSHNIVVDANDNVQATRAQRKVPSRLIEGRSLEVGAPDLVERLEIPVPR